MAAGAQLVSVSLHTGPCLNTLVIEYGGVWKREGVEWDRRDDEVR